VAAANAVALVGAVIVVTKPPTWMSQLPDVLTISHRKVRRYTALIGQEYAEFWTSIGSRELPEIDGFRLVFGDGYFV
jgi:hypothetical protein